MILTLSIIFFMFGLIIGSFLNVVICRYHTERSLGGRSICLSCSQTLRWYELIPIISFIFQKGRCYTCHARVSFQYPFVEFITGVVFAFLFLKFQDLFFFDVLPFALTYAYYGMMFSILIVIAVYDLKHKIIPDTLSLTFAVLAFLGLFFWTDNFTFALHIPTLSHLLSGFIVALPFALLFLVSKGVWMGLGDAKLAIGLGYLLGLSRALSGVVLAFWVGAIFGIILLLFFNKRFGMKTEVPFAPFLVFGAISAFLFELHILPLPF